jgi:uncharacterized protein YqhQ
MFADHESPPEQGEYLQFGGMAVVEGVMMRSPHYWAVAVRAPSGDVIIKTEKLADTWIGRQKWLKKPFLRGTLALLDTMALGIRAMNFASTIHVDDRFLPEEERITDEKEIKKKRAVENTAIWLTMVISLVFSFALFKGVPEFGAEAIRDKFLGGSGLAANIVAEIFVLTLFIGYLSLIRRMPAILEVFRYHGAEHQAINCMEADEELTEANCIKQTRLHPRCGTNFAIIVLLIGFIIFPFVPRDIVFGADAPYILTVLGRLMAKLVILPTVAGISYEVIRAAGKAKDAKWVNTILKPGLATQLITTEEPEEKHATIAIASLQAAVKAETEGELTNTDLDAFFEELEAREPEAAPQTA